MRNIIVLFCCLFYTSCTNTIRKKEAKEKIESVLQVPIPTIKKITDYKSDFSFNGDYMKSFVVYIERDGFDSLLNLLHVDSVLYIVDTHVSRVNIMKNRDVEAVIFNKKECSLKYTFIHE